MQLCLKLATPYGQVNPDVLWLCVVNGNVGNAEMLAKYGPDKKLKSFTLGPMAVQTHPPIVTALRVEAGLKSAGEGNWQAVASMLEGFEDAPAYAASIGYNLYDWL